MAGIHSYGAVFKIAGTTVSEVTSISGMALTADTIDVSNLNSADVYREFIQGFRDGGEVSIEGNFTVADSATVYNAFNTTSTLNGTITLPTSPSRSQWSGTIICTGFSTEAPLGDKVSFSATFKISGKPTLTQIV